MRCMVAALILVRLPEARIAAQEALSSVPTDVTLDQGLKLLEERSPRTAAERSSIAVAAADRITARTLPNPTLSYGGVHLLQGLSTGATTQHQFVVEQPLLLFH